jgi:hypothetical protein
MIQNENKDNNILLILSTEKQFISKYLTIHINKNTIKYQ